MTPIEMLVSCKKAMEEAMKSSERGIPTDWRAMISSLESYLKAQSK